MRKRRNDLNHSRRWASYGAGAHLFSGSCVVEACLIGSREVEVGGERRDELGRVVERKMLELAASDHALVSRPYCVLLGRSSEW